MKNILKEKFILEIGLVMICLAGGLNTSAAQSLQNKITPSLDKICRMHDAGSFLFFKEELKIDPNTIFQTYKSNFGLQNEDEMKRYRSQHHDNAGITIHRYQQYHNGIKVHGAVMNVFEKYGSAEKANGRVIRDLGNDEVYVSSAEALQLALQGIDPSEYQWTDPVLISKFSKEKRLQGKKLEPDPELVYMYRKKSERVSFDRSAYELCWDIQLNLKHGASKHVFISAVTGKQVNEIPISLNCLNWDFVLPFNGVQPVLFSTNGNLCTPYGNTQQFICTDYAGDIEIHTEDYDNSSEICFDHFYYNPLQLNGIGGDGAQAQWGIQKSLDYFWTKFNWRSYDNDYADLDVNVNVSFSDNNGNNAAYDETWEDFDFGYGYDKNDEFDSYTCIDIVGHEYTHGVDDYTADLDYSDESGALDESYADIMGEIIQTAAEQFPFYYDAIHFDWLVGADKSTGYVRSMSNPSLKDDPDTYKGNFWCNYDNSAYTCTSEDNGGVHTNSGVQNFMFYLLVAGGSGVNDNGTPYSVTPIHIYDAEEIAFLSHTYLWGSAEYGDARDAWIQAAIDLFGNCSQQAISVAKAWRAVGVGLDEYGYDQNLCTYIPVGTYNAINDITTNGAGCSLNATPVLGNIYFVAGNQIVFKGGTILSAFGSNIVDAFINPCNLTIHDKNSNGSLPSSAEMPERGMEEKTISIYPNPASDRITVKIPRADCNTTLKIYSTSMKLISTFNFQSETENEISTNDLLAGIYFIESTGIRTDIVKLVISR
ncbi:MAG TPA: M4 family metallopeptidase [Chitinophagales bacterium]|nr:M4 family metallopeptidase [Chitinophagales bacterium]